MSANKEVLNQSTPCPDIGKGDAEQRAGWGGGRPTAQAERPDCKLEFAMMSGLADEALTVGRPGQGSVKR